MATSVKIATIPFLKDPKWPKTTAKVGEEVELSATPQEVTTQTACFEIRNTAGNIVALLDADSSCKKKWFPPARPLDDEYSFFAILREAPSAANGYMGVLARIESINKLTVKGTTITDAVLDACFVPKQEKLVAKFKVTGELPAKGRIEIWGERYPTSKPLYTEDFTPELENKWKWDGKKNDSAAATKVGNYISPQFSPYRLRIVVGPDDDSVKEPYGKGLGKATVFDQQFAIVVQKIQIRVQSDLADQADPKYQLRTALAIEKTPGAVTDDGSFAAMGRLPKENESARIRIPLTTHWGSGQLFDQGINGNVPNGSNLRVSGAYVTTGPSNPLGRTKYAIDSALYTRPEIPIEFVVRLRSRKYAAAPTSDRNKLGRFEPEAVGPVRLEPFAEDCPAPLVRDHGNELADVYTAGGVDETYWKNALVKVKQANHSSPNPTGSPVKSGGQPVFAFWQTRFVVQNDGAEEFDLAPLNLKYTTGSNELTIYLNRTRLELGSDDDLTKKYKDYKEASTTKVKVRGDLTKRGDILWIVRKVAAPAAGTVVPRWNSYPPGTNAHEFYGGVRSKEPNNLFRQDYSTPGGSHEPVIGKGTAGFPYNAGTLVQLSPDAPLPAAQRERVEVQAVTAAGNYLGLAGILFSPSYIGGDCYRLHAVMEEESYARGFGCVAAKPHAEAKTGGMSVWRVCHIHRSLRLPEVSTVGLRNLTANTAGQNIFDSPADPGYDGRPHPGDGINLRLSVINRNMFAAFNEWTIRPPVAVTNATNATPVTVTAPNHGLVNGECIKIFGVSGNTAANGVFVVNNVAGDNFTIHSAYDFTTVSGAGAGVVGNGATPAAVNVLNNPTLTVTGATNAAPIKITTSAAHGLETGNEVAVKAVSGNLDANGIFKVTKLSDTEVTLDDSDGADADPYAGGGTLRRTNVTNANPIAITCSAAHNLTTGDRVYVSGVLGNTAANGIFKVTAVDATNLQLNDSDGTGSGEYISGGTVQQCGIIDPHRGVNLKQYKTIYDGVPGLGQGQIPLTTAQNIQKQFAPFDCYREYLPPNLPAGYRNVARNAIHVLPKGRTSDEAMAAVEAAIKNHIAGLEAACTKSPYTGSTNYGPASPYPKLVEAAIDALTGGLFNAFVNFVTSTAIPVRDVLAWIKAYVEDATRDANLTVGALNIPPYGGGSPANYSTWASSKGTAVANAELAALTPPTPSSAQPKTMPALRWPEYFQHSVWIDGKTNQVGLPDFLTTSVVTVGFCSPRGWSMFEAQTDDPNVSTFTHEMGHGCHLSHFVVDGSDFNWKQHHLLSGDCLMSYEHTSGYLPRPAGAVGPTNVGATADTGWPNRVLPAKPPTPPPNPPYRPAQYLSMDTAVADNDPTIAYIAPRVVSPKPCAKCVLKLRGWNEEKLPCAWNHPDLY
jgi:hypothetical protein